MEEYFPADRLLELKIGSVVQVNSENEDMHFTVSLVGADNGKSVVTTLPPKKELPDGFGYEAIFAAGEVFEMRTIYDGRVVAFESAVLGFYGERLLISTYPEMVETRRLRKDIRFPCALSCDIRLEENESYGVITDISNGGCQLSVPKDKEYQFIEESMYFKKPLGLEIFFPGGEDAVTIYADVKSSVCQLEGSCRVGLAFVEEYECIRKYLESLQLDSVAPFFY